MGNERQWALAYPTPSPPSPQIGWAIFTFFNSLRSESKRIWILSLHIRMFRYIHKNYLFASFASKYSHIFAYKYSIWCKKYVLQWIFASERIFAKDFLIMANICFKIFVQKRIFTKLRISHSSEYLHTGEYSFANIRIPANFRFVWLQII
jgi:hypothetical protein